MNDRAEVVRVKTFGKVAFQVNIINTEIVYPEDLKQGKKL